MSTDDLDLDIKLQDARPRAALEAPPPEQDPACVVRVAGYPTAEYLRVYLHINVMRALEAHAASFPEREVGGVLLGKFAMHQDRPYVRVEEVVLGMKAEGSATQLTFTHETWRQINEARDREHPDLQIVGWYHSHPDLGIFLSRDDLYIHKNFFANERQVALVVDPINHDRGLFVWHRGEVKRDGGLRIYAPAAQAQVLEQFVNAIHAPKTGRIVVQDTTPAAAPAKAGPQPQQPVVVRLEFNDASITPYALMPRSWRDFFGVHDLRTAPRISLKSLLILVLCLVILAMWLQPRLAPSGAGAGKPPAHGKAPKNNLRQWWQKITNKKSKGNGVKNAPKRNTPPKTGEQTSPGATEREQTDTPSPATDAPSQPNNQLPPPPAPTSTTPGNEGTDGQATPGQTNNDTNMERRNDGAVGTS